MRLVVLALVVLFVAVGCSNPDTYEVPNTQNGAYSEIVVSFKGKSLYCVRFDTGDGQSSDSGISCDWVAYHGLRADE